MLLDYATLKLIWWGVVGALIIGFAITDGFDLGIGMLLPFIGRTDTERRIMLNAVGPNWEGNQTWLITAAGASFAAWPLVYAAAFSGMYIALMVLLFGLFLRPVGFDYRSKIADPRWRNCWDYALFVGGALPAAVLGVAFGNLLQGLPFTFDSSMRLQVESGLMTMFNPCGVLGGCLSVSLLLMHGASYLATRTDDAVRARAHDVAAWAAVVSAVVFVLGGWLIVSHVPGLSIADMPDASTSFTPLAKHVVRSAGGWMNNYRNHAILLLMPILAVLACAVNLLAHRQRLASLGFASSTCALTMVILTAATALFPFVLPSTLDPNSSLTVWDATASRHSLNVMLWVVVIFLPLVIAYTRWAYRVMRGQVTAARIAENEHSLY